MRFAILTGDETPDDLRELVTNLRERQRRAVIQSTRDALDADINEALDLIEAGTPWVTPSTTPPNTEPSADTGHPSSPQDAPTA